MAIHLFNLKSALICLWLPLIPATAFAEAYKVITTKSLAEFSPRARADIVDALIENRAILASGGITNSRRLSHFIAQIAAETGGFLRLDENMNYSEDRLLVVFSKRVSRVEAKRLARRPVEIANHVYGGRLGNRGRDTNDGWDYRGSGHLQLTGRENFRKRGEEIGMDLLNHPELARMPKPGFEAAVAYWSARCNEVADRNDIIEVRRCVNGGLNGIDEVRLWYGRALRIFGAPLIASGLESAGIAAEGVEEEISAAMSILERMGYYQSSGLESSDKEAFLNALDDFRQDRGLPPSDRLDGMSNLESAEQMGLPEDLLYELTDPQNLVQQREEEAE